MKLHKSTDQLVYTVFKTKLGWVALLASKAGLLRITLPQSTRKKATESLGEKVYLAVLSPETFTGIETKFKAYYSGKKGTFPEKLDFADATPFQRQVWEATRCIPCGETRSYGWVANQIGKRLAARAVGHALGQNPFSIIVPCHRVIGSNGNLTGFGGGLEMKRNLLQLEEISKSEIRNPK